MKGIIENMEIENYWIYKKKINSNSHSMSCSSIKKYDTLSMKGVKNGSTKNRFIFKGTKKRK